jgi:tRNA (guanine-N7-)-methyltransferase
MRLRKIKNAKEKLEQFSNIIEFNPSNHKGKWSLFFNNNNPIYLEIGMGKGKFITEHATKNKNINYIGLEISESIVLKAARNINELKLNNLILININASSLLEIFDVNEISKIFLNFSDPWPKSRHAKRRLTSEDYLSIYKNILIPTGVIELKTDNRNLFEYSVIKFNEFNFKFSELSLDLHAVANDEIITTEYEEKFRSLGNIIYYIKVEK